MYRRNLLPRARTATFSFVERNFLARAELSTSSTQRRRRTLKRTATTAVINNGHNRSRDFSDAALGGSPMSPPAVRINKTPKGEPVALGFDTRDIPTAEMARTGGVFAITSAKRDALAELNSAREDGQESLDDAANEQQKLDLYLAEGLQLIVKAVENNDSISAGEISIKSIDDEHNTQQLESREILQEMNDWWIEQARALSKQQQNADGSGGGETVDLQQVQWEQHLRDTIKQLDRLLATLPANRYLRDIRDFYDVNRSKDFGNEKVLSTEGVKEVSDMSLECTPKIRAKFDHAVTRYRLQLTKAAAEMMEASWETLTSVSDQDVDREAVKVTSESSEIDENQPQPSTLRLDKLQAVLRAFMVGNGKDRVDGLWALMDKDNDGLLDETEMNTVCRLSMEPVQSSLAITMDEAIDAYPVSAPLPELSLASSDSGKVESPGVPPFPKTWRERRAEAKEKKKLKKMMANTIKNHFEIEIELAQRLRCIYAWANKEHQNNNIESIHVDETGGWSGRKRYVELLPKISLSEFREVQQIHLPHLDHVGTEFMKAFREDLWVVQGKGRQRRELYRDCFLFLFGVSIVDVMITML